jgi:outer membrane protease
MHRILVACLLIVGTNAFAADVARPTFTAGTSLVWGGATELVLRDGTYNDPISRLQWPVGPALALDLGLVWPWADWTSTSLALQLLSPFSRGTMIDEDWNATIDATTTLVYGHSEHTAKLTSAWSVEAGQDFHLGALTLSAGFLYRWASWEGWDGEGTYTYNPPPNSTVSFTGPIIAYRQQWFVPTVGAAFTFAGASWTLTPSVRFGPYSWGFDRDDHNYAQNVAAVDKQAPLTFLDNTRGGLYGKAALEAAFPVEGEPTWGVRVSAQADWGSVGETTVTQSLIAPSGTHYSFTPDPNAAGAWFSEASLSVFVRN